MRSFLCGALVALALPAVAGAHTDDGRRLSFAWPALGVVSSPFGPRADGFHPGIDIGTLRSLTVRAASGGVVTEAGEGTGYSGYGNVVVVALGDGYAALYAHLARPLAHRGERIGPGEVIGVAGCTGACSGTHLHFELRLGGRPLDPLPLLSAR